MTFCPSYSCRGVTEEKVAGKRAWGRGGEGWAGWGGQGRDQIRERVCVCRTLTAKAKEGLGRVCPRPDVYTTRHALLPHASTRCPSATPMSLSARPPPSAPHLQQRQQQIMCIRVGWPVLSHCPPLNQRPCPCHSRPSFLRTTPPAPPLTCSGSSTSALLVSGSVTLPLCGYPPPPAPPPPLPAVAAATSAPRMFRVPASPLSPSLSRPLPPPPPYLQQRQQVVREGLAEPHHTLPQQALALVHAHGQRGVDGQPLAAGGQVAALLVQRVASLVNGAWVTGEPNNPFKILSTGPYFNIKFLRKYAAAG